MKTFSFYAVTLAAASAISALCSATPALAQGDHNLPATGYCTGETVQISGWERDLVRRNKGLEKFHWSAINTVQHYNVVATPTVHRDAAKALTPYHNTKPQVVNRWASLKGNPCIANADSGSRAGVNGRLRGGDVYGQMAHSYETSNNVSQQAQYGGERSTDNRVSGRVMHY